jgi:hypothetical protein
MCGAASSQAIPTIFNTSDNFANVIIHVKFHTDWLRVSVWQVPESRSLCFAVLIALPRLHMPGSRRQAQSTDRTVMSERTLFCWIQTAVNAVILARMLI